MISEGPHEESRGHPVTPQQDPQATHPTSPRSFQSLFIISLSNPKGQLSLQLERGDQNQQMAQGKQINGEENFGKACDENPLRVQRSYCTGC